MPVYVSVLPTLLCSCRRRRDKGASPTPPLKCIFLVLLFRYPVDLSFIPEPRKLKFKVFGHV
ncbi:hypothetical protein HanIR_Chr14g0715981 [Helianthus annuus]|nr:hypothetical protein HanIR_Chr14g0715981 [Helianthus annuus]